VPVARKLEVPGQISLDAVGFLINASRLECLGCSSVCPLCPLAETYKKVDGFWKFNLDIDVIYLHLAYTVYVIIINIIIIGATGTISKSFRKYVSSIPGNHEVRELQNTAIVGTAHILRKVLT
jgi:hypothetical protein